jgi:hypothetical protein
MFQLPTTEASSSSPITLIQKLREENETIKKDMEILVSDSLSAAATSVGAVPKKAGPNLHMKIAFF